MEIIKKIMMNKIYRQWRLKNPIKKINYIGRDNIGFDLCITLFVEKRFHKELQISCTLDCLSKWMEKYMNHPILRDWKTRKGNPTIFECNITEFLIKGEPLLDNKYSKEITYYCDEPACICYGPVWDNDINNLKNIYNSI
jgi:hypothetical protein